MQYRGNANEIERLFNLFPLIESYIEDSIGVQLTKTIIQDSPTAIFEDEFVQVQIDEWRVDKQPQFPSILQQLCTTVTTTSVPGSSNFYSPLGILLDYNTESLDWNDFHSKMSGMDQNQVSAETQGSTVSEFNIDLIDMENLELLLHEQQQRDQANPRQEQDDMISQTQTAATSNMYLHRLDVKRLFKTPEKTGEIFKKFFIALKKIDPHAAIRPVYAGDANRVPVINSPTQVQNPDLLDISKYHKSWTPNQKYGLSGQLLIESSHEFKELMHLLQHWSPHPHKLYSMSQRSDCSYEGSTFEYARCVPV